jgi:hypothetical protein
MDSRPNVVPGDGGTEFDATFLAPVPGMGSAAVSVVALTCGLCVGGLLDGCEVRR